MNAHRILYTRHDGGVSVCSPATAILRLMEGGGGWYDDKAHANGLHDGSGNSVTARMKFEIDKKVAHGSDPASAQKLVNALAYGGCTTAEALDIIRLNDCAPHGAAFERRTGDEIPADRWFRDAWHRSVDGGPILIDMNKARLIQAKKIEFAYRKADRPVPDDFASRFLPHREGVKIDLDWDKLEISIRAAKTPEELRAVWPEELR
jgi:hypothetical protein